MYDARHLLLGLLLKEKSLISYLQIVKLGFGRLQCLTQYYLYQFYIYIHILNIFILSSVSQNMSFSFPSL